jgi:hypothetical protein
MCMADSPEGLPTAIVVPIQGPPGPPGPAGSNGVILDRIPLALLMAAFAVMFALMFMNMRSVSKAVELQHTGFCGMYIRESGLARVTHDSSTPIHAKSAKQLFAAAGGKC